MALSASDSLGLATPFCAALAFITLHASSSSVEVANPCTQFRGLLYTSLCLVGGITASFLTQSGLDIYAAINQRGRGAADADGIQVLLGALLWLTMTLLLVVQSQPSWKAYAGTAIVNVVLELPVIILRFQDLHLDTVFRIYLVLQSTRTILLLGLFGICAAHSQKVFPGAQDETEPLLGSRSSSASIKSTAYDSTVKEGEDSSDDDDQESERPLFSAAHKKVIKQKGGIFGYLAQFQVFWPHLWPSKNRKLQTYFGVIGINSLMERALKVLYPRQFGIVVDKLYHVVSVGGPVPVEDILLWIFYELLLHESCGINAINQVLEVRTSNWTRLNLSVAAFDHVMGLPMSFHDSKASGEVIKAVEQAGSLSSLFRMLAMESAPFLLDAVVALWYVSVLLGIYGTIIVLYVGLAFIFVTYTISIVLRKARRTFATDSRSESQLLYETISNWSTVSFFNRHQHEHQRLYGAARTAIVSSQWDNDLAIYMFGAQQIVEIAGRLAMSLLAAYRIAFGLSPVGNFVAIEIYWDSITMPLWHFSHNFRQLSSDLIDAERLLELFQQTSDITDGQQTMPTFISGRVEFSHVNFGYSTERLTIENLSFIAEPGQTIAIVGKTGSGKSTILKLLMRFYDMASGSINVDGIDIRNLTVESLREAFGFVPQNAVLFNTSIFENVRYSRLDATVEEVHNACRSAAIHDRIMSFPKGYESRAGERGIKLSGGELQRIAIARVILKNPQIVLLDEATSALDTQTESKVQHALHSLTSGRTTIVIAHRLSTIVSADLILMLDKGRIIEQGTHTSLLQQGGKYKDYWMQQTHTWETAGSDHSALSVIPGDANDRTTD